MDNKRIGVLAGLVSVFGVAVQYVPGFILGRWVDRGFEGAIPTIGTAGQSVTIYNYIVDIVGPLATLVMAAGLGYYVAEQVDFATEYRRVGGAIAIGSTIGVLIIAASILFGTSGGTPVDLIDGFLVVIAVVRVLVEVALLVTIGAIAGAAIVTFRTDDERPGTPTDADESPSSSPAGSTREDSRPESQPVR